MAPTTQGICPSCSSQLLAVHGFAEVQLPWDGSTKPFLAPEMYRAAATACVRAMGWPRTTLRTNFSEKAEPPEEPPVSHASR